METLTILQAILAVILHNNQTMEECFSFFAVNIRDGFVTGNRISWVRGEDTAAYMKADKKGRIFVAQKFTATISWGIDQVTGRLVIKPGIIQLNVLKSSSKRGGWLIRTHVQTPILARTKKFQFHGKWIGYWASDAMLEAGLMTQASRGKFGKAMPISRVIGEKVVLDNVNQLKSILGEKIIVPENSFTVTSIKEFDNSEWY